MAISIPLRRIDDAGEVVAGEPALEIHAELVESARLPALDRGRHVRADQDIVHRPERSEEHTSELQSLMRISYAVFCLKKKTRVNHTTYSIRTTCIPMLKNKV